MDRQTHNDSIYCASIASCSNKTSDNGSCISSGCCSFIGITILILLHHGCAMSSVVMSISVGLSVCKDISGMTHPLHQFFVHVAYGCGLILLWWHCNMLRTSSFVDDVLYNRLVVLPDNVEYAEYAMRPCLVCCFA